MSNFYRSIFEKYFIFLKSLILGGLTTSKANTKDLFLVLYNKTPLPHFHIPKSVLTGKDFRLLKGKPDLEDAIGP